MLNVLLTNDDGVEADGLQTLRRALHDLDCVRLVVIAPDGSFQQQSGVAYIMGRISGGHMQGEIAGDACGYRFEADRSGTW